MGEDSQTLANRLFNPDAVPDNSGTPNNSGEATKPGSPNNPDDATKSGSANPDNAAKHRNFLQKMFGLGKDKDKQQQPQQPQPQPQQQQPSSPQN
jgi:ATP-dependent exoDNAse (exonuclease V) alpha subunit